MTTEEFHAANARVDRHVRAARLAHRLATAGFIGAFLAIAWGPEWLWWASLALGALGAAVYYWRKKLSNQPRGGKPAKRRRIAAYKAPEPKARAKFIEPERSERAVPSKKGNPVRGIDDLAATLARVIEEANEAARGVEALRADLERMRSIFGGK